MNRKELPPYNSLPDVIQDDARSWGRTPPPNSLNLNLPPDGGFRSVDGDERELRDYLSILFRRKRTVIAVAALVFCSAVLVTVMSTPIYRSEAVLEVEKDTGTSLNSLGDALTQGIGGGSEQEVFATQIEILKDRSQIEALIKKMNLTESLEFSPPPGIFARIKAGLRSMIPWFTVPTPQAAPTETDPLAPFVGAIKGRISATREGKSRLIKVGMEAKSPEFARDMLRNHIDIYLAQNLDKRRRIQKEAGEWLKQETVEAETKVVRSLAAVVEFTGKNGMVSVDESANHILTFFQRAAESLVKSKEQRVQLEAFQKDGGGASAASLSGIRTPDLEQLHGKLSLLEAESAQMREVYSENAPKLVLLQKQIEFIKARIAEQQRRNISVVTDTAKEQEQLSEAAFEKAKQLAMDNQTLGVKYAVLKKEAETNEAIFRVLLQKSKELQLSTQIIGNNILAIVPPNLPVSPVRPRTAINMLIGVFVALVCGVMAAFVQEHLDRSVRDVRDLTRMHLLNLGMVPNSSQISRPNGRKRSDIDGLPAELTAVSNPTSTMADALSVVSTSIFLTYGQESFKTILFTSASPGEGKTFVSASLASTVALSGKKCLLVEADLRRPDLARVFGTPPKENRGLVQILTNGSGTRYQNMIMTTDVPNLFFLPSGGIPRDPANMLRSAGMRALMEQLKHDFDFVFLDCPPAVGVPDARIAAGLVDGIILIVRQGHASADMVMSAVDDLSRPGAGTILGAVFNCVDAGTSKYGYHYGRYGYGHYQRYHYAHYDSTDGEGKS
ncbi:MAG: polysaccharide biosynthesis tyrosine autokinase [Pseudomonadota bacterium]